MDDDTIRTAGDSSVEGADLSRSGGDRGETSSDEKHIGRRAFLGLVVAGVAALLLGKEVLPRLPGGTAGSGGAGDFRINSISPGADFDRGTWTLTLDGLMRKPRVLSFTDLTALPQVERIRDFYCVEGWGVDEVRWRGVTVRQLMDLGDIDPQATHLVFHSSDGVYTDSLTLDEALRDDTLLAHEVNGELLPQDLGRPLRLVLPGNYGYKYVKWVVRVEAIAAGPEGYTGYWEQYGYPADATIR